MTWALVAFMKAVELESGADQRHLDAASKLKSLVLAVHKNLESSAAQPQILLRGIRGWYGRLSFRSLM